MTSCVDITCPEGCGVALPPSKFNICNPEGAFGQISELFITNLGYPLTDENDASEWLLRMALADSDPAKIWRILVVGSKPESESTEVEMSYGRTISGTENHTLDIRIDEVNQENYDFARAFDCNRRVKIWYKAYNGDAYGGNKGIDVSMKFKHVIPEGTQDLQTLVSHPKWKSKFAPCRFIHPLQGDDTGLES